MPFAWGSYSPSWVEISVNLAALAGFALLFTIFAKFFPIVAISDVRELEARRTGVPPDRCPAGPRPGAVRCGRGVS